MPQAPQPKAPQVSAPAVPQIKPPQVKLPQLQTPRILEVWTHEKLHLPVLTKSISAQGTQVEQVKSVQPGEPPASVFQVPAGYKQVQAPAPGQAVNPGVAKLAALAHLPKLAIPKLQIPKPDLSKLKLPQLPKPPIAS